MSFLLPVYERDLTLVRGRGARLYDAEGRAYLDFAAGIGVNGLGYGDAKVLAAIRRQSAALIHASNLFHNEPASALAERLVRLAFPSRVFFCNSGAEAWETAMKFARKIGRAAGRSELLCFEGAFHGRTLGALSTTWKESYRKPFEPLVPGVRFLPWNDLSAVAAALDERTAAVMLEPVQGEGGVRPASREFLNGVRDLTRERGALLVLDEVQCGLGRTGKLFAFEHAGITPDILTLAKPLGGGLPMGATLLREDLAPALGVGDHGSTFGGNPVAAAASLAVLERLTAPGFLDGVTRRGAQLLRGLGKLARAHAETIAEVRGLGLMVGVELHAEAGPVVKRLRERGVLATKAGDRVLRLLPPLVIKPGDVRVFLEALEGALAN
ncbi:MAG TPA: acetylornithine/succinylornithine family transaminase [Vicinamibacteria bacterium]|nr:acetylornithine/succinylornithine family transaminase [Vicinamibacteria bacterium]